MSMDDKDIEAFKSKYKYKLKSELGETAPEIGPITTREYEQFKKEFMPRQLSFYEKACNSSEKILRMSPDKKKLPSYEEAIRTCHLNVTPSGVMSFSILGPVLFILMGSLLGLMLPLLGGESTLFFFVIIIIVGLILIIPLSKMPFFLADNWRMKASNQMVLCIFYLVTYMRHSSNLELAVDFAAEHLNPPLALDMKKVIWDVETERFDSVKEALDNYLNFWRNYNIEFVESVHLIESSLYESSEERRLNALDKALEVMLDETYERMLHYAHNLQSPLTMLHMLGIVLPLLGLVILPLVVAFMEEVKWYYLFVLYVVIIPIIVYYLGRTLLSKRPSGYGETDISNNPEIKRLQARPGRAAKAFAIFLILFLIGLTPLIMHAIAPDFDIVYTDDLGFTQYINVPNESQAQIKFYLFGGYQNKFDEEGVLLQEKIGPFGLGATIFSLFIPLSFGISLGLYYKWKSKGLVKIREESRKLEDEFGAALFQLGNRLGDGLPAEIAFRKVAEVMKGTTSGRFFELVSVNIQKMGMGVEKAIFDPKAGALVRYPSNLIESSMKVLVESSKKGPLIASQALINVSQYIKEMHRVEERLKDLMADTISSMKSQISFLTPIIAGIVVAITSMITQIIGTLGQNLRVLAAESPESQYSGIMQLLGLGIPTYYFQVIVGLYVVEIIFLLSMLVNGIQNGADKLSEWHMAGTNLIRSTLSYIFVAMVVMLIFNSIASTVISSVGT